MKMHKSEKAFAIWLNSQNKKWIFPVQNFSLGGKRSYRPDFYLPEEDLYIEVVGTYPCSSYFANKNKYAEFIQKYPNINFTIMDYRGYPFIEPPRKVREKRPHIPIKYEFKRKLIDFEKIKIETMQHFKEFNEGE